MAAEPEDGLAGTTGVAFTAAAGATETSAAKAAETAAAGATSPVLTRRSAIIGGISFAALCGLGAMKLTPHEALVRPPGGQDQSELLAACIRCSKCIEACPRHAIKLAHVEDGILSARTPQMDFYRNYCDFCVEENGGVPLCAGACPTGALSPAKASAADLVLGKAEITYDWCLAYRDSKCHVCYDACPYEAMALDDYHRPYVIADRCNGCGACEAACVSLTNGSRAAAPDATARAITVKADW